MGLLPKKYNLLQDSLKAVEEKLSKVIFAYKLLL